MKLTVDPDGPTRRFLITEPDPEERRVRAVPLPHRPLRRIQTGTREGYGLIIMALLVIGSIGVLWAAGYIATYKEHCPSGEFNRGMCMHVPSDED